MESEGRSPPSEAMPVSQSVEEGDESPAVPLLRVGGCLLGSIQHGLHDVRAEQMGTYILREVQSCRPRAVILDFSVIPLVDSFLSRVLIDVHRALRLMGTRLIMAGLPDPVILSMVELGVASPDIITTRDIDAAFELVSNAQGDDWSLRASPGTDGTSGG